MSVHVFGIRHHGPGSARSLHTALTQLQPDIVLIEGPPEGDDLIAAAASKQMHPPVALLAYQPEQPAEAVYYPFATFSPEWQAIQYSLSNQIPVQFIDLPVAHKMALEKPPAEDQASNSQPKDIASTEEDDDELVDMDISPLKLLAQAAGYDDSELWWEHMVEERKDSDSLFQAINHAMAEVRQHIGKQFRDNDHDDIREAYMRKKIRHAMKSGYQRIAVVCGAWHAPVLESMPAAKEDNAILKELPKVKIAVTWVPWTYGRLSYSSGYGAGVRSPGWYDHLWHHPQHTGIKWLTKVAHSLRKQGIDISSAHVIEAVRLADTLATLRDRPLPSLREFSDATQSVMLFGDTTALQLIQNELVVSERLGQVPDDTPSTPLQQELLRLQKSLRLAPSVADNEVILDLRKPLDLQRSQLLHRLNVLSIPWGQAGDRVQGKGSFKESWRVQWNPEFEIKLIEAGRWGNSIEHAASNCVKQRAMETQDIALLAELINAVLLADLADATDVVIKRLQHISALASDILVLMTAVPTLAQLHRYGDVRQTSLTAVDTVLDGMVTRICIGLVNSCSSLNEDAAEEMYQQIHAMNAAIKLLNQTEFTSSWQNSMLRIIEHQKIHNLLKGHCCRIALDNGSLNDEQVANYLSLALSLANDPAQAAAWVQGFLRGSAQLLIHDKRLLSLVDDWVRELSEAHFLQVLPLIRRTFSSFEFTERRLIGERIKRGFGVPSTAIKPPSAGDFDQQRAEACIPLIEKLLGISHE